MYGCDINLMAFLPSQWEGPRVRDDNTAGVFRLSTLARVSTQTHRGRTRSTYEQGRVISEVETGVGISKFKNKKGNKKKESLVRSVQG